MVTERQPRLLEITSPAKRERSAGEQLEMSEFKLLASRVRVLRRERAAKCAAPILLTSRRCTLTRASRRLQKKASAAPRDLSRVAGEVVSEASRFSFLLLLAMTCSLLIFGTSQPASAAGQKPPLKRTASFGAYTANTYYDQNSNTKDAYYEILKNKKSIYTGRATENGEKFVIGTLYKDDPDASLVTMGKDITGDGQPDLVISEWTGGANCCLTFHIFEIGSKFRKIADIDAEFGDQGPHFVQLAKGPGLQIQIYDWTFANWNTDFADSPAPKVILQYSDGTYVMAPELMRTPMSEVKKLAAKVAQVKSDSKGLKGSWPDANIPPELWGTMLDLIYTGHRIVAWQFLDAAWPPGVSGKEKFLDDFMDQLKKSPYWKEVAKLAT